MVYRNSVSDQIAINENDGVDPRRGGRDNRSLRPVSGPTGSLPSMRLRDNGSLAGFQFRGGSPFDRMNYQPSVQSINKLNAYLDKNDYSLSGGDGRSVVGYKTLRSPGRVYSNPNSGTRRVGGGDYSVAIYGPTKSDRENGGEGNNDRDNLNDQIPNPNQNSNGSSNNNASVDSTVTVPPVQDFGIADQISAQEAAESARRLADAEAFERMLQATANANDSPAQTFGGSAGANPNPSAWENILTSFPA
jgi:hypothetical protein